MEKQTFELTNGTKYIYEQGQWSTKTVFFADVFQVEEHEVPQSVRDQLANLRRQQQSAAMESDESEGETGGVKGKGLKQKKREPKKSLLPTKATASASMHHTKKALPDPRSHVKPSKSSAHLPRNRQRSGGQLEQAADDDEDDDVILITDSHQLIRPLRAELKAKNKQIANELFQRMQIRQKIMEPERMDNNGVTAVPYEPRAKKNWSNFIDNRDNDRKNVLDQANKFVTNLERRKHQEAMERKAKEGVDEPAAKRPPPRRGTTTFEIDKLAEFAASKGLRVLNLEQFICATDKREAKYNARGECIFCRVHNVVNTGPHPTTRGCPFISCACANCYLVGKLAEVGLTLEH